MSKALKVVMDNLDDIHGFIEQSGFGVLIDKELQSSHLPFVLNRDEGEMGTLYGHFSYANQQWKNVEKNDVLVIFSGPHAYISPTWYAKKPAVPTWNYIAVNVKGKVSILSKEDTAKMLELTIKAFEPALLDDRDIVTPELQEKLTPAIVGFKIEITHAQGKRKLGQDRSEADQRGVCHGLRTSKNLGDQQLWEFMHKNEIGIG